MSHPRATAALVLLLASLVSVLTAYVGTHPLPLPPCPTDEIEGAVSCVWDADTMGDGNGRSFTVDEHGTPTYH